MNTALSCIQDLSIWGEIVIIVSVKVKIILEDSDTNYMNFD